MEWVESDNFATASGITPTEAVQLTLSFIQGTWPTLLGQWGAEKFIRACAATLATAYSGLPEGHYALFLSIAAGWRSKVALAKGIEAMLQEIYIDYGPEAVAVATANLLDQLAKEVPHENIPPT